MTIKDFIDCNGNGALPLSVWTIDGDKILAIEQAETLRDYEREDCGENGSLWDVRLVCFFIMKGPKGLEWILTLKDNPGKLINAEDMI